MPQSGMGAKLEMNCRPPDPETTLHLQNKEGVGPAGINRNLVVGGMDIRTPSVSRPRFSPKTYSLY